MYYTSGVSWNTTKRENLHSSSLPPSKVSLLPWQQQISELITYHLECSILYSECTSTVTLTHTYTHVHRVSVWHDNYLINDCNQHRLLITTFVQYVDSIISLCLSVCLSLSISPTHTHAHTQSVRALVCRYLQDSIKDKSIMIISEYPDESLITKFRYTVCMKGKQIMSFASMWIQILLNREVIPWCWNLILIV